MEILLLHLFGGEEWKQPDRCIDQKADKHIITMEFHVLFLICSRLTWQILRDVKKKKKKKLQ